LFLRLALPGLQQCGQLFPRGAALDDGGHGLEY
jgi:hypothetical protein